MLAAFRRGGYEIWTDDFGSGFLSLGVLKDYTFDEIKIDMSFLSSSSEKSRTIIESTVRMAKAIGVRTLAEGVETEEQYQFLRSIGCEKVQGYLFGKPMPGKLMGRFCRQQGIAIVTSRWRNYYLALGRIDYLTDEPLAVVEDDGRTLKILFANERIKEIYRRDGVTDLRDWERRLNAHGSPVHSLHRDFVDNQLHEVGDTQTLTYPSGGHYMLLTAEVVAHCENHSIYRASLQYVQVDAERENQRRADILRNLFYVFRDVALIDFPGNYVEGFKSSLSDQPIGKVACVKGIQLVFDTWETEFVYPEDRARFHVFAKTGTFVQRLKQSAGGMLHGYFRSRSVDGTYMWLHHVVFCVPRSNFEQVLYATAETGTDLDAFRRILADELGSAGEDAGSDDSGVVPAITDHALWRSLIEGSCVKYFWKDRQRRFLGVSQRFLDFYGLDSERDVFFTKAMIGRFANSQFFVLQQYESEQEVHGNAKRVQCSICGIHRVGEWPCAYRAFSIMDLAEEYVRQGTLDDEFDNRMGLSAIHRPRAASWRPSLLTRRRFSSGNSSGGRDAPWKIGRIVDGEAGTISFSDGAQ